MNIDATKLDFIKLNRQIKDSDSSDITLNNVLGQRYIGAGVRRKTLTVNGTAGNALGAYLTGCDITVYGNAQDAVGDTMNDGNITVFGNVGDTAGYAMRGGRIMVRGNAGFRVGIHMKEYGSHVPTVIIGGTAGDFLGEYQAGGIIAVLGLETDGAKPKEISGNSPYVGAFCGTGMHGGSIYVRGNSVPDDLPPQITVTKNADITPVKQHIADYCALFGGDAEKLTSSEYYLLSPASKSPYKQLYCVRGN